MAIFLQVMESTSNTRLAQIEADAGKRPPLSNSSINWWQGGTYPTGSYVTVGAGSSTRTFLDAIRNNGQIPWLDWYANINDPSFSLKQIYLAGTHDAFLTQWATDMAAWGHPFILRFAGEMNGSWRPSEYELNGFGNPGFQNARGDFVLMWRHVHDIMAPIAPNITWFWCPNQQPSGTPPLSYASIFPGIKYVDIAGFDAYNWAGSKAGGGKTVQWATFTQICRGGTAGLGDSWAELIALDPNIPLAIGEHGCDPREGTDTNVNANTVGGEIWNGQKKASWHTDEFNVQLPGNGVTDFTRLKFVSYFNVTDDGTNVPVTGGFSANNGDWPLEDPTAASGKAGGGLPQAAWQAMNGFNSAYFARGGQFALPDGLTKVYPYEGIPQYCRFDNAVLFTGQGKLQGFWKLNEKTGTAATDSSGNARNGVYNGGFVLGTPPIAIGIPDSDVTLNGTTGYVNIANNAGFWVPNTGKLTVCGVFQLIALPATNGMVVSCGGDGNGRGWEIRVNSTGSFEVTERNLGGSIYSDAITANGVLAAGNTYFFCWSIDSTLAGNAGGAPFAHLYYGPIGGALVTNKTSIDTTTLTPVPVVGTGTVNIGRLGDNTSFLNIIPSRIAIWSDAVSQVSAQELFSMLSIRRHQPRSMVS